MFDAVAVITAERDRLKSLVRTNLTYQEKRMLIALNIYLDAEMANEKEKASATTIEGTIVLESV